MTNLTPGPGVTLDDATQMAIDAATAADLAVLVAAVRDAADGNGDIIEEALALADAAVAAIDAGAASYPPMIQFLREAEGHKVRVRMGLANGARFTGTVAVGGPTGPDTVRLWADEDREFPDAAPYIIAAAHIVWARYW